MYKSIYYDSIRNKIHLWGDGKHNDAGYQVIPFEKYAYILDAKGEYKTIDGYPCRRSKEWSVEAERMGMVYEHNVQPTTRFLIDRYLDHDEPSSENKVLFIDIEILKGEKYSTPAIADNVVNAITYIATGQEHFTCLLLNIDVDQETIDEFITVDIAGTSHKIRLITFNSEKSLLSTFITQYQSIGHNIITGWNVDYFDMPYLYNRIRTVLDIDAAISLSPDARKISVRDTDRGQIIGIAGVTILDYLFLYKKFTYTEQSNYRLNTISLFELNRGKIEYDGDLDHLYRTDIRKFAEYNIVDVELVLELDKKLDLIQIALGICHKGHVAHNDIQFTSAYLDGAALTYCKRNGLVASSNKSKRGEPAQGAFVKQPTPGLYKWVYDLDLTSLYPMNIITLNISPETKHSKVHNWNSEEFVKGTDRIYHIEYYQDNTALGQFEDVFEHKKVTNYEIQGSSKLRNFLEENNLSIASNGVIYSQEKQGLIPSILDLWFNERDEFKNLRKIAEKEGNTELAAAYDRKQLITKILLNSFYGVLLLPSFRFYDKDNGEAVTLTGQSVIHWASKIVDYFYNKELNTKNIEYCVYTDTDSIFEPIEPLFRHRYGDMSNYSESEIIEKSKSIINAVQTWVNDSYTPYGIRYHNVKSHRWNIKQELIAKRAFWVGNLNSRTKQFEGVKKRYAQWIVDKEGHSVNYMDVKGLDVVRSSFPACFRQFMDEILTDILHDAPENNLNDKVRQFKSRLNSFKIHDIMLPTGVKEIDKWKTGVFGKRLKGTPVHVKSALNYNDLLDHEKTYSIPSIEDGDKILWCYLKQNPFNFDTIALKGYEDPESIVKFVNDYIDRDRIFESILENKLNNFWLSLGWGRIVLNELSSKFFKF